MKKFAIANSIVSLLFLVTFALLSIDRFHVAEVSENNANLERCINTFRELLRNKGESFTVRNGKLMAGSYVINDNFEVPDKVREIFGGTATVFMGDVRVSTNVQKKDGTRAVGTRLEGLAYDAVFRQGKPFRGETTILGVPYYTAYDPIRDSDGNTIGALYVGLKKSDFLAHRALLKTQLFLILIVMSIFLFTFSLLLNRYMKKAERALEAEQNFLQTLIDTLPTPVFYKSINGRYLGCNRAYEAVIGISRKDLTGKLVFDIAPPHLAEIYHKADQDLFQSRTVQVYESSVVYADGIPHEVIFYKATFPAADGSVGGLIGTLVDISELKRAEKEKLALEQQYMQSQKLESLGVLAGGIAHDFNNLLQAILGNLDLAKAKLPQDVASLKNINQAVNAAKHAAKLTNMMLAYSGKGNFVIKELSLTELVEENAHMLAAAISKSVKLDLQVDYGVPPVVADAGQLQQVIMNLITNASEAIEGANGVITLSTGVGEFDQKTLDKSRLEEKLTAGRYVWMKVHDTGCGMDTETMQKLFDPFYTTKFTGRGLGMSAVLGIIRAHKGGFLVESAPGEGTTMLMILPVAPSAGTENSLDSLQTGDQLTETTRQLGTILVVDDEEYIRTVSLEMLETLGFTTLVAEDGKEALRIVRALKDGIDLVLLDQSMPGMDGVTTFQELRLLQPEIKVLLASGYSEKEVSERFLGMGLNGFIQKPFTLESLSSEVSRVLA